MNCDCLEQFTAFTRRWKICVILDVGTMNYSCSNAPAPDPQKERKANESIFNGNGLI